MEDNNEQKKDFAVSIVNLSNYVAPEISETPGRKWVKYGDDNDYFEYLLDRYRGSPTNHGLINGIAQQAFGKGYVTSDMQTNPETNRRVQDIFAQEDVERFMFDLKCLGFYVMVVRLSRDLKQIAIVNHSPVQNWRSGVADGTGRVNHWYYSDDWSKASNNPRFRPKAYPAYHPASKEPIQVYVYKPYRAGSFYYPTVDYMGGLQYAQLEEEISNFHLSNIMNGLQPSTLVNFNNGDPGKEEREEMERRIQKKWGGSSNAGRFILAFNEDKETAATIDSVPISDADKQYMFLSEESARKIMVAHRVTSPLLFGIRDSAGLGSNTDEIRVSFELFTETVIEPYREVVAKSMEFLLTKNNIFTDILFIPLIEMKSVQNEPMQNHQPNLSSHEDMTEDDEKEWLEFLKDKGEVIDENEWVLIDEQDALLDDKEELAVAEHFESQGYQVELLKSYSEADKRSSQDSQLGLIKIRYGYRPQRSTGKSRDFCVQMVSDAKGGTVYRKEDILQMGFDGVNNEFAPSGRSRYSIWLFKGGVNCHHKWTRLVYLRKTKNLLPMRPSRTPELENDRRITVRRARELRVDMPVNDPLVATRPIDMPNQGAYSRTREIARIARRVLGSIHKKD